MKKILVLISLATSLWATSVTFKGEEVTLNSKGLQIGMDAPVFTAVDKDFREVKWVEKKIRFRLLHLYHPLIVMYVKGNYRI